ncbi:MAG: ECF-type sigma factor [Gemmataceae bacterium]|nr:ECF-type sigma factor [Gemmataceae bacterium]
MKTTIWMIQEHHHPEQQHRQLLLGHQALLMLGDHVVRVQWPKPHARVSLMPHHDASPHDSIAHWLLGVRAGDAGAAQALWERYFTRLLRLAQEKLPGNARRAFDEEDVAHSALRCFFHAMAQNRYPQLADRHGLWNLLVVITARKAKAYLRRQQRHKRGRGAVQGETAFLGLADDAAGIDQVLGAEPTPEFAAEVAEQCQRLLDQLGDPTLRTIAVLKMEGHTVDEIAARLDSTKRTIERRLHIIRKTWEQGN